MTQRAEGGVASYRLKRFGERLDQVWKFLTNEQTILILIYAFSIFLLAGGIFDVVENPPPVISSGQSILFLYPSPGNQTVYESIAAAALMAVTLLGVLVMYQSTRRLHEPRYSTQLLLFGSLIFILGFLALTVMLTAKGVGI